MSNYTIWSHAIDSWFKEGRATTDPAAFDTYMKDTLASIGSCWESRGDEDSGPIVRPSTNLSCARQGWLVRKHGSEARGEPNQSARITWAIGHLLHGFVYSCIEKGLPEGFTMEVEHTRQLPDWWPEDDGSGFFATQGHTDLVIRREPGAGGWPDSAGHSVLVDVKSSNETGYRNYGTSEFWNKPDGFGYMSQLAVYSDGGDAYDATFLAAVNRNNPGAQRQGLHVRQIPQTRLAEERERLQRILADRFEGDDPGPEFHERHGSSFYCREFCPVRHLCER